MRNLLGALLVATIAWAGATAVRHRGAFAAGIAGFSAPAPHRLDVEVLEEARQVTGDPDLNERYNTINQSYFGGGLPAIPVSWEPRLDEIAASRADGLVLEGLTDGKAIVINPSLRSNRRALVATLCHEMVHVRLVAAGGAVGEDHGPEFQMQLRRLLDEGAFEGAFATDDEKQAMKASLDAEVAWLDAESTALSKAAARLNRDREKIDRDVDDLNARITDANARQTDWPSDAEQTEVKGRLSDIKARANAHNVRVAEFNRRIDDYNRGIERYNLVNAYPDGLADTRLPRREALPGVGARRR